MAIMETGTPSSSSPRVQQGKHEAHKAIQKAANRTVAAVDRVSGAAHTAVDKMANMVNETPGQLKRGQAQIANAYESYVVSRPFVSIGAAFAGGVLIGLLWRRS